MNDTLALWEDIKQGAHNIFISNVVLDEISENSEGKRMVLLEYLAEIEYTLIQVDDEIRAYAEKIVSEGILTDRQYDDCLHIGCAVVNQCNMLLSWNFKHMVKVKTLNGIRSINAMLGYHGIDIFPPSMII
jgi:predicted nucleic acid-binding protein